MYFTQEQFNNLPPWYQAILRSTLEQSEALRQQAYPMYNEPRVAGATPFMERSYDLAKKLGSYQPYLKQAESLLRPQAGSFQEQLAPYMNPYMEGVINNINTYGMRNFQEKVLPALEAQFVGLGQHGSSRHKDLALRAARDIQGEIGNRTREALASGFGQAGQMRNQDEMRKIQAAQSLGTLGMMQQQGGQSDVNMMNALGVQQQAQNQQNLNERQAEFWRRMNYPQAQQANALAGLQGLPQPSMGTTTMQYTAPQPVPQMNQWGQIGSMAGQLYGMNQMPQGQGFKGGGVVRLPKMPGPSMPKAKGKFGLSGLKFKTTSMPKVGKKLPSMRKMRGSF